VDTERCRVTDWRLKNGMKGTLSYTCLAYANLALQRSAEIVGDVRLTLSSSGSPFRLTKTDVGKRRPTACKPCAKSVPSLFHRASFYVTQCQKRRLSVRKYRSSVVSRHISYCDTRLTSVEIENWDSCPKLEQGRHNHLLMDGRIQGQQMKDIQDKPMMRQKGYTLIELLTTLGVATVLISVAMPNMQSFRMNSRQTGKINELISTIHLARNTAITTNTRVTLCASSDGNSCESVAWDKGWIAFVDRDSDQNVDDDESILRVGTAVDGVTISSGQYANFLMYRPNGRVMGNAVNQNNGQFTFCDNRGSEHAKAIMLDLSGRPRVVDNDSYGISLSCGS